jgi:hypothetical protein
MKKIMLLLLTTSYCMAMEQNNSLDIDPNDVSRIEQEKLELKKKKLKMFEQSLKIQKLTFLAHNRDRIKFDIPGGSNEFDAVMKVGTQEIYKSVLEGLSTEQREEMSGYIKTYMKNDEEFQRMTQPEISQK